MTFMVKNPKTGRMIIKGGALYKRLTAEGVKFGRAERRSPRTRASPKRKGITYRGCKSGQTFVVGGEVLCGCKQLRAKIKELEKSGNKKALHLAKVFDDLYC